MMGARRSMDHRGGFIWLVVLVLCVLAVTCLGGKTTTIVRHTDTVDPQADGFWTNKTTWNGTLGEILESQTHL
uniref:GK21521 n=1 Tax=Drosophila willistoni TaxID=7260 RepID=B4MPZ8_DROWI